MRYRYASGDQVFEVIVERHEGGYRAVVNGEIYDFELLDMQQGQINLRFKDRPTTMYWAAQGDRKWISLEGCTYLLEKPKNKAARRHGEGAEEDNVRAPMPAQVRAMQVQEGDRVEKGQALLVLEAMKMEIRVRAPHEGRVAHLFVQEGQAVDRGQLLAEVCAQEGS